MGLLQSYSEGRLTTLNSLKYGEVSETDGPLIQKTIPTTVNGSGPQYNARVDDLVRITKLLTQPPGLKHLGNQTALSAFKSTPQIKTEKTAGGVGGVLAGGTAVGNLLRGAVAKAGSLISSGLAGAVGTAKSVGSTLAQIPVNGTGTHFVQGFAGTGPSTYLAGLGTAPHTLAQNGSPVITDNTYFNSEAGFYTGDETAGGRFLEAGGKSLLKGSEGQSSFSSTFSPRSIPVKKEVKFNLGSPGRKTSNFVKPTDDYSIASDNGEDTVNSLPPGFGETFEGKKDIIKLKVTLIDPESPASNRHLQFRAFLDSFADNFSGTWNSFNYVGRGEQFHTYSTFNRGISFSFKIAAQSRLEMKPLYQKIITLASSTAPTYSGPGYMRGTLAKLTLGDYLFEIPGFFESVNYTWEKDYPWEIALNSGGDDSEQQELPMVLNCQVSFKPIHNFIPQTGNYPYITNPQYGWATAGATVGTVFAEENATMYSSNTVTSFDANGNITTSNNQPAQNAAAAFFGI